MRDQPTPEQTPERIAERRQHRCMRCNEKFPCAHGPNCKAGELVMPNIVTPDGRGTTEHCPQSPNWEWVRAYGDRMRAAGHIEATLVASAQVDALTATLAHLTQENDRLFDLVRYQRAELLDAGLISTQEYASLLRDGGVNGRGSVARLATYDALRKRAEQAEATLARVKALPEQFAMLERYARRLSVERQHEPHAVMYTAEANTWAEARTKLDAALVDPPVSSSTETKT